MLALLALKLSLVQIGAYRSGGRPIRQFAVSGRDAILRRVESSSHIGCEPITRAPAGYRWAARSLAAVHDAGFVHSDVRPDNIVIRDDGHVYLLDFGLAIDQVSTQDSVCAPSGSTAIASVYQAMAGTGSLVETPFYLPTSSHEPARRDPYTDQFAYCVTFFEALYGIKPYTGTRRSEICTAIERGAIRRRPRHILPRWLDRLVVRGLGAQTKDRHPSMHSIVASLDRPPVSWRTRGAVAGTLVAIAGIAHMFFTEAPAQQLCERGVQALQQTWGPAPRTAVEKALTGLRLPYADETWQRVRQSLDRYADSWAQSYRDACEATHLHAAQSPKILDLRMQCLRRSRDRLAGLVQALQRADENIVVHAANAADALPEIKACDQPEQILAATPCTQ